MTEFTKDNSYPCPSCGEPKLKDEWRFCRACLVLKRAEIGGNGIVLEPCPHCSALNDSLLRRCSPCGQKLRPKGIVRDLTSTMTAGGGGRELFTHNDEPDPPQVHPSLTVLPHHLSPLVAGMLEYLPESGSMELDDRLRWLQLLEANLSMAYGEHAEQARIEIKLVWKRRSFWSRLLGRKA